MLEPYQERVVEEKQELDSKIKALRVFTKLMLINKTPVDEQDRLLRQLQTMTEYSNILNERIIGF